ncbi:hypothetical protein H0484_08150 [Pusillimonas sp. CC-YST705]|uniref:Uncharacterized protein n=1 Tax=Mesopusillimonas faecipullorum TaxID=2755040 RepID=A0ABS8CCG8_9BURK|nr:hypothetical protein [Mesopusillimonas faecipullorum]MCB5363719.1 hypothetical protein [Mesopusillimonas faecipullorum]
MKNLSSSIVLTDSLERKLLQAEMDHYMNAPLKGVFTAAAHAAAKLSVKVVDALRFQRHAGTKAA